MHLSLCDCDTCHSSKQRLFYSTCGRTISLDSRAEFCTSGEADKQVLGVAAVLCVMTWCSGERSPSILGPSSGPRTLNRRLQVSCSTLVPSSVPRTGAARPQARTCSG